MTDLAIQPNAMHALSESDQPLNEKESTAFPGSNAAHCYVHPERNVVAACVSCGHLICEECDVLLAKKHHCKNCLAEAEFSAAPPPPPPPNPQYNDDYQYQGGPGLEAPSNRLERSRNDAVLGGVCGGFAKHSKIDPALTRIIFLLLLFFSGGTALLIYIVAWLVIPLENDR